MFLGLRKWGLYKSKLRLVFQGFKAPGRVGQVCSSCPVFGRA